MNRIVIACAAVALLVVSTAGVAVAQQVVSPSMAPAPAAPRMTATRPTTTTRQYRSYSVNPSRGEVRRNGVHEGDATWRHAGSKAHGHFATGR
jgi:hypothetical protein